MTRDACRLEQIDNDAAIHAELLVISGEHGLAFQIVVVFHLVETVSETCIEEERDVVIVFLVT